MNDWSIGQIWITYGAVEQIARDCGALKVSRHLMLVRVHSELKWVFGCVFGRLKDLAEDECALDLGVFGQ